MAAAKPDILFFDSYPYDYPYPWIYQAGSPTQLYWALGKYRTASLLGNDGTGKAPIPFGLWTQNWAKQDATTTPPTVGHTPSESELRLNQFAALAFGAKVINAFSYDSFDKYDSTVAQIYFDADGKPTPAFYQQAQLNHESRNLGPSLVRLLSTNVQMAKGANSDQDNGVAAFDGTADPFLKAVSAKNLGTTNGGVAGDVIVGWYRPLTADATPATPGDDTYFMIVNGLSDPTGSAADTTQTIHLQFDFGTSGITELQRLNRDTGLVEDVPLISDGASLYHLDLTLPGGTGDLFKYDTGSAFVVPEPSSVALLALCGLAATQRRRRRRA
jgi:hypothetical protein